MSETVKDEISIKETEENPLIIKLIKDKKIRVFKVKNEKAIKKLMDDFNIEVGEAETIIFALEEKASIVATDDRNAIRACKLLKIDFTTAISFLMRLFEKNLINKDEALIKLHKLNSVARYRREIIEDAKNLIEGGEKYVNKNT